MRHGTGKLLCQHPILNKNKAVKHKPYAGSYDGEWHEDYMHGHGTLIMGNIHDRHTYTGPLVMGAKHGQGMLCGHKGNILEGRWVNDKMIGEFMHTSVHRPGEKTLRNYLGNGIYVRKVKRTKTTISSFIPPN